MALTFTDGSSDRITIADTAAIRNNTTSTTIEWVKLASLTNGRRLGFTKDDPGNVYRVFQITATNNLRVWISRTTESHYVTNDSPLSTGIWLCLAATFDSAGAPDIAIYSGNLTTLLTESTYVTNQNGSGAIQDSTGAPFYIGNSEAFNVAPDADLSFFAYWDRVLTLDELKAQQIRPHATSGCQIFIHAGFNGVTNIPDWSGNGHNGTGTGLVIADHVPLGLPFGFEDYAPYAVPTVGVDIRNHIIPAYMRINI